MKLPLSWLKDFVDIDISVEEVARKLTLAGLEVEEIRYVGWKMPESGSQSKHEFKTYGLEWQPDKLVVAAITEVMPHPAADRLVLCKLLDGVQEHVVLTGAPNLYEYKGLGALPTPLKVAYAREGATLYDGHADGQVLTTLKRTKIRGVESYSMVCSEKELGISEEHEGVIFLDADAPVGMPLADYMGDAVFSIDILPNMARNVNVYGIARELAALTGKSLKRPEINPPTRGESIQGKVCIEIRDTQLNPRFVLGLVRNVNITPSPYFVQRRLRLSGTRPINCVVDATNYAMFEMGEPLHAFDYDVLLERAKGNPVTILTRTANPGEKLTTLDGVERLLQPTQVLVCDSQGALSIAGVMGGAESEVTEKTHNVLLEGAAWNFINIRRTSNTHGLHSEASYRFSRGVHPSLAETGVRRGLQWMAAWSGGQVAPGLVDEYPNPPEDAIVKIGPQDVRRLLGIELSASEIAELLKPLEFEVSIKEDTVTTKAPPFRMDIGQGVVGLADVMEEVARMYGYDRIPETRIADELPPQAGNPELEKEENLRNLLVALGLQEVITYRMTSPERQERLGPQNGYVQLANPIAPEKRVLRRSLLANVLDTLERNARLQDSMAFFELGPVFLPMPIGDLPMEKNMLVIALSGLRQLPAWDVKAGPLLNFFDLKGVIEGLLKGLGLREVSFEPLENDSRFHPGKCARLLYKQRSLGVFGEIHPLVKARYEFGSSPVLAAEFDLAALLEVQPAFGIQPVFSFPPMLEDIALVVDESIPASKVEALIRQTGGALLSGVRLFDVFRGEQIGEGKKSLAYALTYQAPDRTLTDKEAAQLRGKIIKRLEYEIGARLRG
ncbi:MAG: phenylalanine--tRNA ligase subunit beta [Chloroflexi bacterium GWB2_49_20]|nr:MAG: phenylalanine--tRNA ligase subunit beta [Chloroflexi bacterium GWB2_49_20]OGN80318.1 MAG: phenylalanine--tRNA ligase subunit beta [Chloroflexi bacterium GWC2_49_37]OGN86042.1 MAG: phenylalanine--tRNA ligase subunit beta [Chloroflexi bacterium GWD2_49_16]